MVFKRKAANLDTGLKFYLYNRLINFVEYFKYLGCILSTNLNVFDNIDRWSKSLNRSAGILLKIFLILTQIFYSFFLTLSLRACPYGIV